MMLKSQRCAVENSYQAICHMKKILEASEDFDTEIHNLYEEISVSLHLAHENLVKREYAIILLA